MLARAVTLSVLGQVGNLLVGFAASLLLARWLGPSDRGLLALMYSAATTVVSVLGIGLPFAVVTFASRKDADRGALLGNTLLYSAGLAIVAIPLAWIFHASLADALGRGQGGLLWVGAAVLVPLTFLNYTTQNQLFGLKRFGYVNALLVLSKVGFLGGVVVAIGLLGYRVGGGLVAMGLTAFVMSAGSLPVVVRGARPRFDRVLLGRMLRYGGRVQIGTIFQIVNYRLDIFVLQLFRPLADVGYYVVAQIVAELVLVLASGFQSSLNVIVSSDGGESDATSSSLRHHSALAAAAILANAIGGPVLLVLYGPSFYPAIVPMLILLPGMWFLGTGQVITGDLRGRDRPGVSSALAGGAMVSTIALDFALIPPFGVTGAAVASLCSYTVFGVASLVTLSRMTGLRLRTLAVPTRSDLVLYPAALRSLRARLRRSRAASAR